MRLPGQRRVPRTAFTLIELLVVIAIIAILVGLTAAGVMKFLGQGPALRTRSEISQLAQGVALFKTKFQITNPPSRLILHRKFANYGATQLDIDSVSYLTKMFPRLKDPSSAWMNGGIEWGPPGWTEGATLQGQHCLVFFLGGKEVSGPNGVMGWTSNPLDPTSGGATSISPFYEFKSANLVQDSNGFFVFTDPYGSPYAYFSSYTSRNGYLRYGGSDCSSLGVSPYMENAGNRFHNPETFQIIAAGANKSFGGGGVWTPATAGSIGPAGNDDMSNFHSLILGAGGQ